MQHGKHAICNLEIMKAFLKRSSPQSVVPVTPADIWPSAGPCAGTGQHCLCPSPPGCQQPGSPGHAAGRTGAALGRHALTGTSSLPPYLRTRGVRVLLCGVQLNFLCASLRFH